MTPEMKRAIEQNRWVKRTQYAQPFSAGFEGIVIVLRTDYSEKTRAFRVSFEVETSNTPEKPAGSLAFWSVKLINKQVVFPIIARWAAACAGIEDKEEIKKAVLPLLERFMLCATDYPDNNGFIGSRVHLATVLVQDEKGNSIRHNFSPVSVVNAAELSP